MKKKLIFGMMLLTLFTTNAKAISLSDLVKNHEGTNIDISCTAENKKCDLTLTGAATQDIVVDKDEEVTLNLGTYSLTSTDAKYSPIHVKEGGKLTLKGTGLVKVHEGATTAVPTITVDSKGTLNMNGGVIEGINVTESAAIYNAGTLYINDGVVKTIAIPTADGKAGAWGITNVGTTTITSGTFTQGNAFSVISNAGKMDINGGVFNTSGEGIRNSLVTNAKGTQGQDKVTLTITEGEFTSAAGKKIISNGTDNASTTITGGLFTESNVEEGKEVTKYMGDSDIVKLNGTMYVGASKEKIAESAKSGDIVEVVKGSYAETEMPAGVIVKNSGDGIVTINGVSVLKNDNITVPLEEEKVEKDYTIIEGVTYETEEDITIVGSIITEENDIYKDMIKRASDKGYLELYKMFEFYEKDSQTLTKNAIITFNLGKEYNGREAYIIHRLHDGTYQEEEIIVKDGKISITISELSPFVVALKEEKTEMPPATNNPQTSSMDIISCTLIAGISLTGLVVLIRKKKEDAK